MNALTVPGRSTRLAGRLVPGLGRALRSSASSPRPAGRARPGHPLQRHRHRPPRPRRPLLRLRRPQADAPLGARGDGQRRRALRPRRRAAPVPARRRRAAGGPAAGDDAGVGAHRGRAGRWATRSRRCSSASPPTSPTRSSASPPSTRSTTASKEVTEAIGARSLTDLSQLAPGALIGLGARLAGQFARRDRRRHRQHRRHQRARTARAAVLRGRRLLHSFGAGPVVDGMGLINIVGSYERQFVLSFTADRGMMPDPGPLTPPASTPPSRPSPTQPDSRRFHERSRSWPDGRLRTGDRALVVARVTGLQLGEDLGGEQAHAGLGRLG